MLVLKEKVNFFPQTFVEVEVKRHVVALCCGSHVLHCIPNNVSTKLKMGT